jgi:predicted HicB family RNase H-like nuclease
MKRHKHKARGPHVAASMRLTPANHKFLHKEAAKQDVSANFYINQLLKLEAKKKGR